MSDAELVRIFAENEELSVEAKRRIATEGTNGLLKIRDIMPLMDFEGAMLVVEYIAMNTI